MIKLVGSSDFNWQDIPVSLLKVASRGLDHGWATKRAAVLTKELAEIRPVQGHTLVHVLAVGDTEKTGANRNGDGFRGEWNEKNHGYFTKHAHLFSNHKNHDPKLAVGSVKLSAYNKEMGRIELVIALDNVKCAEAVNDLESGKDISVSMGCVTDPAYPVLTAAGYKGIADVVVGDLVLTHTGAWRKVTELHRRVYTGKLCTLHVAGLPIPLELTADHPMMAKVFGAQGGGRPYTAPEDFEQVEFDWAHVVHLSPKDHIQYIPAQYSPQQYCALSDMRLAKIMGYYLAEGSFGYNNGKPAVVQFSCHMDDDLPRQVPALLSDLFPDVTCTVRAHHNSKVGLVVDAYSTSLACFLDKYLGHLAGKKGIPPEIFLASREIKLAFLGAWLSGDGFVDLKGVHWSSCNLYLQLQARDLLASLGIAASIYKITHKAGTGFNLHDTIEYTLNISAVDAAALLPYAGRKLERLPEILVDRKKAGNGAIRFNADGTLSYRVREITTREAEDVQTYNFEVEGDESFTLAGLASHNCRVAHDVCSICGNKAPTPREYCGHAKHAMTRILEDGRQVYVDNPDPHYFDISLVPRPAERTAYSFRKVAGVNEAVVSSTVLFKQAGLWVPSYLVEPSDSIVLHKRAMLQKLAEMEKEIEGKLSPVDQELTKSFEEPKLEVEEADKLQRGGLEGVFGSLADAKVTLPLRDFLRLISRDQRETVESLSPAVEESLPGVFSRMLEDGEGCEDCSFDGAHTSLPAGLQSILAPLISSFGAGAPLQRRITVAIIRGKPAQSKLASVKKTASPEVEGLARLYARYKLAVLSTPGNRSDEVLTRLAVLQNYTRA